LVAWNYEKTKSIFFALINKGFKITNIQVCPCAHSPLLTHNSRQAHRFPYFGQSITSIDVRLNGDFYLISTTPQSEDTYYHVLPFHKKINSTSVGSSICFDTIVNRDVLANLTKKLNHITWRIRLSVNNFTLVYALTWYINENSESTLYQVLLCVYKNSHGKDSTVMIVSYSQLDIPSDISPFFYVDGALQENTYHGTISDFMTGNSNEGIYCFLLDFIEPQTGRIITLYLFN
jgi:hypothetical protein